MNNLKPLFSIIIPTFNHAHFIGRCLDSVLSQTYQNWEAIVVNNFSTDNTVEIVESYNDSRIRLVNNPNGGIIAVSRNKGISESKGDWICFLDSDDWWYSNKLEISMQYTNDYDLVHHDLDIYSSTRRFNKKAKGRNLKGNILKDMIINGNAFVNSSVIIKKEIVDLVGRITEDKRLIAVEDYDYWIRVTNVTNRIKYLNKSMGAYWVGGNISYSMKQIEREELILNKYLNFLIDYERNEAFFRFYFNSARRFHYFKNFDEAKKSYLNSINSTRMNLKIKSLVGYLFCCIKIKI